MIERKDTRTLLRKEESHLKKKELIGKLLKIIDYLWETETTYQEMRSERQLEELKRRLFNSTFQFSSMYRSWIPKPNKPKQEPFPAVDAPHQAPPVGGKVALRRSKRVESSLVESPKGKNGPHQYGRTVLRLPPIVGHRLGQKHTKVCARVARIGSDFAWTW